MLLTACGAERQSAEYRVIVATDLHYIAPTLTDHGAYFQRLLDSGDAKVTEYSEELTEAFLAEVIAQRPEALLLTGDLTFNGALESHRALAEKLAAVEAAGVPVLVLPGNHDVYNWNAARFEGDSYELVPSADSATFRECYAPFGFDEAIAEDEDSLSYVYQLNESTRVLMLDANTAHDPCGLSKATLSWVKRQLKEARTQGQNVLACGHQNLFQQSMFARGYVMNGAEELRKLFASYGVKLFLSGHMHVQHIRQEGGVTEIATSALSVTPCQYGVLTAAAGEFRYETRPVDVSAWARTQGSENPELLDFAAYAAGRMDSRTRAQAEEQLQNMSLTGLEREAMLDYTCRLNRAYFAGDLTEAVSLDPVGRLASLWADSGTLFGYYFTSFAEELGQDYTRWSTSNRFT